jgi:hypothetical protein
MMYDRDGAAINLRRLTSLSLAWWHNYKWATGRIMVVFGNDFIGPMFHHLFPDRNYDTHKMSHTAKVTYLSYIRLAYARFKPKLDQALLRGDLTTKRRTILQNLSDMCTYFIPVVILLHCTPLFCDIHTLYYYMYTQIPIHNHRYMTTL